MAAYPPSSSQAQAEEYELPEIGVDSSSSPGPSKPRRLSGRTLTLHPNKSSSILFAVSSPSDLPSGSFRHRRNDSNISVDQNTPRRLRSEFLSEDRDRGDATEEVHLPDFGQMLGFNPDVDVDHFGIAQAMRSRWKRKLYLLMEEPNSGREAFFVHAIVTGAILFSALLTTLSTLPSFHTDRNSVRALFGLDTTLVVLFTIEYLARSFAHSDSWSQYYKWATSFFALIDLLAIFPYYIEVARNEDTSILFRFSILRTFRLLRVFRAFRYQNQILLTIEVMYVAVNRSKDALVALAFFMLLVLVLFATLIYFAERGTWDASLGVFVDVDGDPSLFDSIPQTAWFALVTMSTVGYGDVVPRSSLGKLLTVPLLMFGLLLIALPSFVLGRNFAIVFDAMTTQAPSAIASGRASMERPPTPPATSLPQPSAHAPLLPTSIEPTPRRGNSPNPSGTSNANRLPRMWDGGSEAVESKNKERDLTNIKLAKNQLVLLEQIDDLRSTIDRQGEMLERLMLALNVKADAIVAKGKARANGDEDQFALGSDDDDGPEQSTRDK
ncbi:hypothetical protein BCR39DRAFT_471139 [Naematelia encephala]|uniref:Ion transport domain-containing protein n=1 Tax=Naematelia encephala TaxID=71784 RepID=A0A1Y2ATC1_9TREE|nr:hypothetical protein BCR39DRAFT_471139 [Naematelia encephala]